MKFANCFCVMLALGLISNVCVAQQCPAHCKSADGAVSTLAQEDGKCSAQCPVETAMAALPKMTYKVGTESACCDKAAAALAESNKKPIQFVVGEKSFENKELAFTALVESTESFVNDFVTPKKCEASGATSIAGTSCQCPVEAGQKAELVNAAIKDIKMSYKVGKETTCCDKSAAELVKTTGEKMTYVVNGEETCCSLTARLNLAKAKYAAAVKVLAATGKSADSTTSEKSGS